MDLYDNEMVGFHRITKMMKIESVVIWSIMLICSKLNSLKKKKEEEEKKKLKYSQKKKLRLKYVSLSYLNLDMETS